MATSCKFFLLLAFMSCCGIWHPASSQGLFTRKLTVKDGLPQSFISALVQDRQGFIWIATRDGLAKYDGRKFKSYSIISDGTAALSDNIISSLYLDSSDRLWIRYEHGGIDILNTATGAIRCLAKDKIFKTMIGRIKDGRSIAQDSNGKHWLLSKNGGVYLADLANGKLSYLPNLIPEKNSPHSGIARSGSQMVIIGDSALYYIGKQRKITKKVQYTFKNPSFSNARLLGRKDNSPIVRANGDLIIPDEDRLIVYQPHKESFFCFSLPFEKIYKTMPAAMDAKGNLYLDQNGRIFVLSPDNRLLTGFAQADSLPIKNMSMLVDRSGMLWLGTNGTGIRQYDLRLPRMPAFGYRVNFTHSILKRLHVPEAAVEKTFLSSSHTYQLRWMAGKDGKIWFSKSGIDRVVAPNLLYWQNGKIHAPNWKPAIPGYEKLYGINALASSKSGKVWGLDDQLRLISFDLDRQQYTMHPPIAPFNSLGEISGMMIDGEDTFWIAGKLGFVRYSLSKRETLRYKGLSPTICLERDPKNDSLFWMGTQSRGLVRFNRHAGKFRFYTTRSGLPNNTIYSALHGHSGKIWCSTNRGLFSFDPATEKITSFTTADGLPEEEFNRFHYFRFPSGEMAFGGTEGYTVFDPGAVLIDNFSPDTMLTGISINNAPSDFGNAGSPLPQYVNSLDTLVLDHKKNFLTFEFAAPEYNMPEKLQYRYRLRGLDSGWVPAGTAGSATYTSIPPGEYVLEVNASNTAGVWSPKIKRLRIVITPPFWKTWWFLGGGFALLGTAAYCLAGARIRSIHKKQRQRLAYEREAMELEAKALRAQMNPHFIFNCLNSIKALIVEGHAQRTVAYLTSFSKLIRNQLTATREISLYEELKTCRLYLQLESLRFGDKITYEFSIAEGIDLHGISVPALIIQPFIENAIIHGILPKEQGGRIAVSLEQRQGGVLCRIDDDGVGRPAQITGTRRQATHDSRGMQLAEERLDLYNKLNSNGGSHITIIDKKDRIGLPEGTQVVIFFNLEKTEP